jgi:hypothetical protein
MRYTWTCQCLFEQSVTWEDCRFLSRSIYMMRFALSIGLVFIVFKCFVYLFLSHWNMDWIENDPGFDRSIKYRCGYFIFELHIEHIQNKHVLEQVSVMSMELRESQGKTNKLNKKTIDTCNVFSLFTLKAYSQLWKFRSVVENFH